jgi:hypothetical protein
MLKCTAAWVSAETPLAVEMPVCGKHGKAMKPFPTFPIALENRCGDLSHFHSLDDAGIYLSPSPAGEEIRG